jgi:predicted Zn-dependent protease
MSETAEDLFKQGVERYQAGESVDTLIPHFRDLCDRAKHNSPAWTCLAWLYLLADKPTQAYKAARKAVKYGPDDAQARVNLAIAMLETGETGVRSHIEMAQQLVAIPEVRTEIEGNFADGLSRKPDWPSLVRVQTWLFGGKVQ